MWPHGSVGVTVDGLHFQVIGVPAPPSFIPVIAKYMFCGKGVWRRPSGSLCRLNPSYGPRGVEKAAERSGINLYWDESYGAWMPYLYLEKVLFLVDPWSAAEHIDAGYWQEPLASVARKLAVSLAQGCSECIGITGSLAMGIAVPGISDIDLIVDSSYAEEVYEKWRNLVDPLPVPASEGGVRIGDTLEWRRGYFSGIHVSWLAAPKKPAQHCPPLAGYPNIDRPFTSWKGVVSVEPRQPSALLYPPCVKTGEGFWLVSYEYNAARLLYEGGELAVRGLRGYSTIYLAARPEPGNIARASPRKREILP